MVVKESKYGIIKQIKQRTVSGFTFHIGEQLINLMNQLVLIHS